MRASSFGKTLRIPKLLMLKSLELSALVVVENNEWSMSTKISDRRHSIDLDKFATAYDIKYVKISGNDPNNYFKTLYAFKQISFKAKSPALIEVMVTTIGESKSKTPEFPDGIYYYVVTDDFPFFTRCLKGEFN